MCALTTLPASECLHLQIRGQQGLKVGLTWILDIGEMSLEIIVKVELHLFGDMRVSLIEQTSFR